MIETRCPKCNQKLSVFYLKQECPNCGINMLYYNFDERLQQDAEKARKETEAFGLFGSKIKKSSIGSALTIIRLVLFFTPLGSMCLPMFTIGDKTVSLIALIQSIISGGFDIGALTADVPYFLGVVSMALVILLSLAEIIVSLFSAFNKGLLRNIIASAINLAALLGVSIAVMAMGGKPGVGFFLTIGIYIVCDCLHFAVNKKIGS